jgi:hypothetical protein
MNEMNDLDVSVNQLAPIIDKQEVVLSYFVRLGSNQLEGIVHDNAT